MTATIIPFVPRPNTLSEGDRAEVRAWAATRGTGWEVDEDDQAESYLTLYGNQAHDCVSGLWGFECRPRGIFVMDGEDGREIGTFTSMRAALDALADFLAPPPRAFG